MGLSISESRRPRLSENLKYILLIMQYTMTYSSSQVTDLTILNAELISAKASGRTPVSRTRLMHVEIFAFNSLRNSLK
jgi:hypothetical protein